MARYRMLATLWGASLTTLGFMTAAAGSTAIDTVPVAVDLGAAEPRLGFVDAAAAVSVRLGDIAEQDRRNTEDMYCIEDDPGATARVDPGYTQNACHYARGSTLVMHVFINHRWGTWEDEERDEAGAKALEAKSFYLEQAPPAANLSFDNGTTGFYFYVEAYVDSAFYNNTWNEANAAMTVLGITDDDGDGYLADDYSLDLQFWNGGYDNVMLVFQVADIADPPDFSARASGIMAACFLYTDNPSNIWAHEWGHLFGGCDEYQQTDDETGELYCHNGTNCDECPRPFFLDEPYRNENCELASCAQDVDCIMQHNTLDVCAYTRQQWSWEDEDFNGQLDWTKRIDGGVSYDIMEMWNGGSFVSGTTTASFVAAVTEPSWTVFGLRSPAISNYDLRLYLDNTLTYQPAWSGQTGTRIDFVVGDYSRSRTGLEHVQVELATGVPSSYTVVWQGTGQQLHADGVARNTPWSANDVVQIWDIDLLAGETLTFDLEPSGGIDVGMALFWSYGDFFFAGRHQALWERDVAGTNGSETYTYDVPSTGTYGLVIWKNGSTAGNTSIVIGPGPITLAEETPVFSAAALRLFNYTAPEGHWAGVASRPDAGTEVSLTLYDDAAYVNELASSDQPGGELELVAVHYNEQPVDTDHLRVPKQSGTGGYRTEWEQSADDLTGVVDGAWSANHVVKMWDVSLQSGQTYVFRQYHPIWPAPRLDTGLYLFDPWDGHALGKADAAASSDSRPAIEGGEWITYTAVTTGDHGLAMVMNNEGDDDFSLWWGPRLGLASTGDPSYSSNEVVFGTTATISSDWVVWGARPNSGHQIDMWLMSDSGYSSSLETSTGVSGVNFVVADHNHATSLTTRYPRFRSVVGTGSSHYAFEAGLDERLPFSHSLEVLDLTWNAAEVVTAYDVWIDGAPGDPRDVLIQLEVLTGDLDLGLALFLSDSPGGESIQTITDAVAFADAGGVGAPETLTYSATTADDFGVVIFNQNANGGTYRLRILDPTLLDAEEVPHLPHELAVRIDRNPFVRGTEVAFTLPREGPVRIGVFDVTGRRVRSIASGNFAAGDHLVDWDGRGPDGALVATGVYFIRLDAGGASRVVKVVKSPA